MAAIDEPTTVKLDGAYGVMYEVPLLCDDVVTVATTYLISEYETPDAPNEEWKRKTACIDLNGNQTMLLDKIQVLALVHALLTVAEEIE